MKYIIMIAYEFPPVNTGGSFRPWRFAQHLSANGIYPIIITPKIELFGVQSDSHGFNSDECTMKIVRTDIEAPGMLDMLTNNYYFNIVGTEAKRWKRHLFRAFEDIARQYEISAVYVTVPPFSVAALGTELCRRYGLPLVLDLRDAWSQWVVTPYASFLHYRLTVRRESLALNAADAIVVTSSRTLSDLCALHPAVDSSKVTVITNSYAELAQEYKETITLASPTSHKPLRIGYVGSFYYHPYQRNLVFNQWWKKKPYQWFQYVPRYEDWLYRSPYFFFQAVKKLIHEMPAAAELIKVEFVGEVPQWLELMVTEFDLNGLVTLHGRMSHSRTLEFQRSMDGLLITSSKVLSGYDYSIAGKSFEYMSMMKPILAFVCEGAQRELLEPTGLAITCPPDDIDVSISNLSRLAREGWTLSPNISVLTDYHSTQTTARLASIIHEVTR